MKKWEYREDYSLGSNYGLFIHEAMMNLYNWKLLEITEKKDSIKMLFKRELIEEEDEKA